MKGKNGNKILIVLVVILLLAVAVLTAVLLWPKGESSTPDDPTLPPDPTSTSGGNEVPEEDAGVPFATKYIVLSYPSELEDQVSIQYEELTDGQTIIFTTDLTGEELELFRFSISKSGTEGYEIGILKDAEAGELYVCMNVKEYSSGNWTPEEYAKLIAMQERVNDIIIQFHADPRFTATKP